MPPIAGGPPSEGSLDDESITCPWAFACFGPVIWCAVSRPRTMPLNTHMVRAEKGSVFYVKNLARALPKGIVQERSKQSSENWSDDIDP